MTERPDGSTATVIGWILVVVGVLASFFVAAAETPVGFWFSIGLANLGVGLGVLLLSLGYLVRAIWFLPGREIAATEAGLELTRQCTYCDRLIEAPDLPCSAVPVEELKDAVYRINEDRCVEILTQRRLLSS